nr:DUF1643 domain-containing protein [Bacteroidia bacterium]
YIKNDSKRNTPDLLVIMMNPGGSRPKGLKSYKDITINHCDKFLCAEPDITQDRIWEFMEFKELKYACILNLIDKCETNSTKLRSGDKDYTNFKSMESTADIIKEYAPNPKAVLIAWGCKEIFKEVIERIKYTLSGFEDVKIYGFAKNDNEYLYFYHPLVRGDIWLSSVKEINNLIIK